MCVSIEFNGQVKGRDIRKEKQVRQKNKNIHKRLAICFIILKIDDRTPSDFDTANPLQVVRYLEMRVKSRNMKANDLR